MNTRSTHTTAYSYSAVHLKSLVLTKKEKRARRADDIIGYSLLLFVFFFFNLIMK